MKFLSKIENEELRAEIQAAVEAEIENAKELVRNDADAVKEYKMQGFKEAERNRLCSFLETTTMLQFPSKTD